MAAGILCAAFSSLSSRKELMVVSPRTAAVKKCASDILEAIEKEEHGQTVADFAMKLLGLLRSPLEIKEPVTMARRREKMWTAYLLLREKKLPPLWKEFFDAIKCSHVNAEPLFMALMSDSLFDGMIKDMFDVGEQSQSLSQEASHS